MHRGSEATSFESTSVVGVPVFFVFKRLRVWGLLGLSVGAAEVLKPEPKPGIPIETTV